MCSGAVAPTRGLKVAIRDTKPSLSPQTSTTPHKPIPTPWTTTGAPHDRCPSTGRRLPVAPLRPCPAGPHGPPPAPAHHPSDASPGARARR
ncbi:hypothetical protein HMPREF9057_02141, partial [Actinomyces sp. oral taxon 171 str. F0337]